MENCNKRYIFGGLDNIRMNPKISKYIFEYIQTFIHDRFTPTNIYGHSFVKQLWKQIYSNFHFSIKKYSLHTIPDIKSGWSSINFRRYESYFRSSEGPEGAYMTQDKYHHIIWTGTNIFILYGSGKTNSFCSSFTLFSCVGVPIWNQWSKHI